MIRYVLGYLAGAIGTGAVVKQYDPNNEIEHKTFLLALFCWPIYWVALILIAIWDVTRNKRW